MLAGTQPRPAARLSLSAPFWTRDWVVAQGVGAQVKTFSSVINIRDGDGNGPAFPALSLDPAHQNLGSVAIMSPMSSSAVSQSFLHVDRPLIKRLLHPGQNS